MVPLIPIAMMLLELNEDFLEMMLRQYLIFSLLFQAPQTDDVPDIGTVAAVD